MKLAERTYIPDPPHSIVSLRLESRLLRPPFDMRYTNLIALLATAALARADCSTFGTGASDTVSGTFSLAAFDPVAQTTTALHVINVVTIPYTGYHVFSVRSFIIACVQVPER